MKSSTVEMGGGAQKNSNFVPDNTFMFFVDMHTFDQSQKRVGARNFRPKTASRTFRPPKMSLCSKSGHNKVGHAKSGRSGRDPQYTYAGRGLGRSSAQKLSEISDFRLAYRVP